MVMIMSETQRCAGCGQSLENHPIEFESGSCDGYEGTTREPIKVDREWLNQNEWPESIEFELPSGETAVYRRDTDER